MLLNGGKLADSWEAEEEKPSQAVAHTRMAGMHDVSFLTGQTTHVASN